MVSIYQWLPHCFKPRGVVSLAISLAIRETRQGRTVCFGPGLFLHSLQETNKKQATQKSHVLHSSLTFQLKHSNGGEDSVKAMFLKWDVHVCTPYISPIRAYHYI